MRKIKSFWIVVLSVMIILWLMCGIIPFFEPNISDLTIRLLSISFSALTALFTGVAFVVAYSALSKQQESLMTQQENLKLQQESLVKQTDLGVFSVFMDSMKIVTNSKSFKQCQDYILSDNFDNDKEFIRQKLKKGIEDVRLDDYNSVLENQISSKDVERLRVNRDKIKTFCMRMEFMGIIIFRLQEETAKDLMLDLYGHTIQKSYKRLESLIKRNEDNPNTKDLYPYYTYLYKLAKERGK